MENFQSIYRNYINLIRIFSPSLSLFIRLLTSHKTRKRNEETANGVLKRISSFLIDFSLFEKNILKKNTEIYADTHVHIPTVRARVCVWQRRCQKTCGILAQGGAAQQQTF